jgi:hypothetical protein
LVLDVTRRFVSLVLVGATMTCLAQPGGAADWQGMAIGQSGPGRERSFADAFHATAALARGGGRDVLMLRDVTPDAVMAAISGWPAGTGAILYLSGVLDGDRLRLTAGDLPLSQILAAFEARAVDRLALLVEDCAALDSVPRPFDPPQQGAIRLLVAASSGRGPGCPPAEARLTETLTRAAPAESLQAALGAMVLRDDLGIAVPIAEQAAATVSPILPAAAVVEVIRPAALPPSPVRAIASESVRPAAASYLAQPQETGGAPLLIFAEPSDRQIMALPRASGLPEPSIIVGRVAPQNDAFGRAMDLGDLDLTAITHDDLVVRRTLQDRDPALFGSLVAAGAFDPPTDLMARALQQELARMGCYTAGVDGIWGNGSRAAVQRYFDERPDAEPVTIEPEAPLFRQIILRDDIACRAPQATPTARSTAAPQPAARATQAAPRPQSTPQPEGRRIQSGPALGVFR